MPKTKIMQTWMKNKWRNTFKVNMTKEVITIKNSITPDLKNSLKRLLKVLIQSIKIIDRHNFRKIVIVRDNKVEGMSLRKGNRNKIKINKNRLNQTSNKRRKKLPLLASKNSKRKGPRQLNKRVSSHRLKRKSHIQTCNLRNSKKSLNKARKTTFLR